MPILGGEGGCGGFLVSFLKLMSPGGGGDGSLNQNAKLAWVSCLLGFVLSWVWFRVGRPPPGLGVVMAMASLGLRGVSTT